MEPRDAAARFPPETAAFVEKVYIEGLRKFEGSPQAALLAAVFCRAVRDALLDEIENETRSPGQLLEDVLLEVKESLPAEIVRRFALLDSVSFQLAFQDLRLEAVEEGIPVRELAEALRYSREIVKSLARGRRS